MFRTAEGDKTLDADDIQQQVEQLKLYRDPNSKMVDTDADVSSSDSSSDGSA